MVRSHVAAALFLLAAVLPAQDYRARVQGAVTDPTQAAVTGARVSLRNVATGVETVRETDGTGQYLFDFVPPGGYTITVEAAGFGKVVWENVAVQTRGDVTVDVMLKVGEITQAVTVSETGVALELNTTTMSQTITGKMLQELPVLARNPFTLVLLDPAVVNRYWDISHRNPFYMQSSNGVDVGGSTGGRNDLLLDGVPIGVDSRGSYSPPMDAVQEVAVQQNSVDAEFGHSAGGVLSVSMKAGTNEYHGTAYYFGRNPALNAVSNAVARTPNQIRNHVWGGTAGGPILKNRVFTFVSYEQWKNKQPNVRINTLPTDLERVGDFSRSLNASGGLRAIYDPWTTRFDPATSTATRTPFPGNVIPPMRIDPTAAVHMPNVWKPNGPGDDVTGVNNYKTTYPWDLNYWNLSNRTDFNLTSNWRMYTRYSVFRTRLDNPNYAGSPAVPSDNGGLMDTLNAAADSVWTLTPTTVLNVRFGVSYLEDDYNSEWAKWGESGLAKHWPNNPWYKPYIEGIPAIYYPNFSIGNAGFGKSSTWFYRPRKYNVQGTVAKDRGRHYLKAGMSQRHSYGTNVNPNLMNFSFGPAFTSDTFISPNTRLSGDAWATFLLGAIESGSGARFRTPQNIIRDQWGVFVQDDIKLNRTVTLNLGLRYEYETAPIEERDRMSRYLDLTQPIPEMQKTPPPIPAEVAALNNIAYRFNGAWVYTDSGNRALYQAPKNLFLPRAGVALRLGSRTALRIGYARYAIPMLNAIGTSWYIPADGFNAATSALGPIEGIPRAKLSDPFPASSNPLILPAGKKYGRYTNLGDAASWTQQDLNVGVNDRINVTVQRELPGGIRTDITYFANLGHNIPTPNIWGGSGFRRELNIMDPELSYKYKGELARSIPNPFYQFMTPDTFPGPLRNQRTVTVGSLLKPYPHYGALGETMGEGISNRYHALQIKAERAFAGGYSFVAGYNFNREWTADYFNLDDRYIDRLTMLASDNPRHRLSLAGTYEVPIGRGRQHLGRLHPVLNAIIGGWSTSHIFMWNSGAFLRFGQMEVSGDPILENPTRARWFNTSVFAIARPYTPRTNPQQYEGLTGPGYWSLDSTLVKYFPITERMRVEFRMEAYNLSNSFMPTNPNLSVTSSLFGRSTGQANYGRELQYTMRVHF